MVKHVLEQLNLNSQLKVLYAAIIDNTDEIDGWEATGERYRSTDWAV